MVGAPTQSNEARAALAAMPGVLMYDDPGKSCIRCRWMRLARTSVRRRDVETIRDHGLTSGSCPIISERGRAERDQIAYLSERRMIGGTTSENCCWALQRSLLWWARYCCWLIAFLESAHSSAGSGDCRAIFLSTRQFQLLFTLATSLLLSVILSLLFYYYHGFRR